MIDGSTDELIDWLIDFFSLRISLQVLATKEENFTDSPAYVPPPATTTKSNRDNDPPETAKFRVSEDELQEVYDEIQDARFNGGNHEEKHSDLAGENVDEDADPMERWVDSEEEFSPQQFTGLYYDTLLQRSKKELRQFHLPSGSLLPVRAHPHIHELYMSYLVKSLRNDNTVFLIFSKSLKTF